MADFDARAAGIFFDVQRGLPRQGPGSTESTLRALSLCAPLPERPAVLDIGCGPGMQTVALAKATGGTVTAVDTSDEYLGILKEQARDAGVAERICAVNADMSALPFASHSFDLVWSEGAAYIMGFADALAAWKRLLNPRGVLAVSELVWLRPDPPVEASAFFAEGYPAMTDIPSIRNTLRSCGYEPVSHFTLPDRDWWKHYYAPLEAKLPSLRVKYAHDEEALGIVRATEQEIEIRRRHPDAYGYVFFVMRPKDF